MPSIFERLSQQGTAASKQRDAEEREGRLKSEERRQKEAAALTPKKNDLKLKAMQRSPVPQDRINKNMARSSLFQQGTASSKQRHAEEREIRLKNEERRQKETAALTPKKNDLKLKAMQWSPVPQDRIQQNVARPPLPQQGTAVSSMPIFERLSQQGTATSNQRDVEEKEIRLKNEERRQKEAAALTPKKNDRKLKAMQRSLVPQDLMNKNVVRSPKRRNEFYDRLAKQETISSAAHHDETSGFHPPTMSPTRTHKELSATSNRLYKQGTASSKAHNQKPKEKSPTPKKKVATAPPPSFLTRGLDRKASGPPIPLQMDVYIRTTKEKKSDKPYNTLEMEQNEVRKQINLYAMSKISAKALAYEIINALFHRDFIPGNHWKISSTSVEQLDAGLDATLMKHGEEKGGNIQGFFVMKEAVCDHKDVHRTARASAKIKVSSEGVYVDEYSFYNLNDALSPVFGEKVESKMVALAAKEQEEAAVTRMDEERAAVKKSEEAAAAAEAAKKAEEEAAAKKAQETAAAEAEARRLAVEEAEAAKKAEEEAAAKKVQEAAEAEARRLAMEAEAAAAAEAAKKAEEEAAAKKAQEAAEAEARRLAMEKAEAAKKAEEEEAASKRAQEAAAAEAEARRLAVEEAEAAKKAEEEEAAAKKAQETVATAAAAASAGSEQVQEEVKAVVTCEAADDTKVEMQ